MKNGHYVSNAMPNFRSQHPKFWEQIAADAEKWMPQTMI